MRFVFYYPLTARVGHHLQEFVRLRAHSSYRKYGYFIPQYFNHRSRKVAIFWNNSRDMSWRGKIYRYMKVLFWMLINKINPFKVDLIFDLKKLDPTQDILFFFPFLSLDPKDLQSDSSPFCFKGLKVFHFSHYFSNSSRFTDLIKELGHKLIIGEGPLDKNPLFQTLMGSQSYYSLPFVLRKRYQDLTSFEFRKVKCLACGTKSKVSPFFQREFCQIFQSPYLHRLRGEIFEKQDLIRDVIDCFIFDFDEFSDYKPQNNREKFIYYFKQKIGNNRKRFFSFDIVQKYNEYQMFVSPEEESGSPSISFIEGMACGCAYLGRPDFYVDFGMKPHVHFIPYDGSLDGLKCQIRYYRDRPDDLKQIAVSGKEFVRYHCNELKVSDDFFDIIKMKKHAHYY